MTALAPNARAFMMCHDDEIPPSAITGIPCLDATFVTLYTALACALPTAHTSCVVPVFERRVGQVLVYGNKSVREHQSNVGEIIHRVEISE